MTGTAPTAPPASDPFERAGRRLALQLWIGSILCWWVVGITLSNLWWLVNDYQRSWILFCYAWQVPVVGWTGTVLVPWLRWRSLTARVRAGDPEVLPALGRFPSHVAAAILATSSFGYLIGAVQIGYFAALPLSEFLKIVLQGPVLGALFGAAGYLLAERALRLTPIPRGLLGAAPAGVSHSLYSKVLSITLAVTLGVATPVFLLGLAQDQRRREDVRGTSLRRFLHSAERFEEVAKHVPAFGPNSYALAVDRATGRIVAGRDSGTAIEDVPLDYPALLRGGAAGWYVSRSRTHQVVAYRHLRDPALGDVSLVVASPIRDYGKGMLGHAVLAAEVLAVALVVGMALAAALARSVVEPLTRLRAAASRMAEGDLAVSGVAITGGDEVAALAREFDRMATRVRDDETSLRAAMDELERAHRQLLQAERLSAVGRLVSGVAHELNNPLAAILHYAEELRLGDARSPEDLEAIDAIGSQSLRCRAIVRDLLSFARRREDRREPVRAADTVTHAVQSVRAAINRIGATVTLRVAEDLPVLMLDPAGMEQVIANLVSNAADAAGRGGQVIVAVDAEGDGWRITVEDDGPGIAEDVLPRIFEPFFTTKPVGAGTGLGLPVSLGIIEQLGGTLKAENPNGRRGARFVVRLPGTHRLSGEAAAVASPEVPLGAGAGRVLLVDDEPVLRSALRRYFQRHGWTVEEAVDGERAREVLATCPPKHYTAVLSDLKMPGISGVEVHDWLKRHRPDLHDRLILMTGDVASPEVNHFLARTTRPVLEKPFELERLGEALRRLG